MIYSLMALFFVVGYIAIALEHTLHIDKAASALLMAVTLWTLLVIGSQTLLTGQLIENLSASTLINTELRHHLAEIAEILFFLMGAMVIVELIDAHDGFSVITNRIHTTNAVTLLWIISTLTFFFSALLDNLTTVIVMISLLRKLVTDKELRWWFVGTAVICANAGGAWSPIGDVTTTMLWIGNQVTASHIIVELFLPSVVAAILPLIILTFILKDKKVYRAHPPCIMPVSITAKTAFNESDTLENTSIMTDNFSHHAENHASISANSGTIGQTTGNITTTHKTRMSVLILGLGALAFVPIFKTLTHLPPYMGILLGLSVLWVFTELVHRKNGWYVKQRMTVVGALTRVDMSSILFFLGILLAVSGLATAGHLSHVATWLDNTFSNLYVINILIGLMSALVDNVPLVAGAIKMYPLLHESAMLGLTAESLAHQSQFLQDGNFWHFLAYCAGTGGSCLIIGSAAGVAAMGMEKMSFIWYLKHISMLALIGYLAGAATYIIIHTL